MNLAQFLASANRPVLAVADALAARQWELALAAGSGTSGTAWRTPPLVAMPELIEDSWRGTVGRERGSALLSADQSRAVWHGVVEASPTAASLISPASAAAWAAQAWRLLGDWGVAADRLRADPAQADFAAFLDWCREYRARLRAEGWTDRVQALWDLVAEGVVVDGELALVDMPERSPMLERFLDRQEKERGGVLDWPPDDRAGAISVALTDDGRAELSRAVEWIGARLRADPSEKIALVVPDLAARKEEVRRALAADLGGRAPIWLQRGAGLVELAVFGDALRVVELLSPQGGFSALSRWLRSPFFQGADDLLRASSLETRLRGRLEAQMAFGEAYRRGGLSAELRREIPAAALALDGALERLRSLPRRAAPIHWARAWRTCLHEVGWRPEQLEAVPAAALEAWEAAVRRFVELGPVVGDLDSTAALELFRRSLTETEVAERLPATGVHVFEHPRHIGPGYSAAWVMEFTERRWPEPENLNPLLPWRMQVEQGMPRASPAAAYAESERVLRRVAGRVPQLVLSAATSDGEQVVAPSSMLDALDAVPLAPAPAGARGGCHAAEGGLESVPDPAPVLAGDRLPGGARTLDLQAACPVRAFCETRLHAVALEPLRRGLSPRRIGVVVHRALELLCGRAAGTSGPFDAVGALERVDRCVRRAFLELGPLDGRQAVLAGLEEHRVADLLRHFLGQESERPPFTIEDLEKPAEIVLAGRRLHCRIDRIDRLADGGLVIFDYKTGPAPSAAQWFEDRLRACQLPLYAQSRADSVRAVVLVSLRGTTSAYRGCAEPSLELPGPLARPPADRSWQQQIERWHVQLETIVEEFAAGDARLFLADAKLAEGAYAPLTRVYAHRARRATQP